MQDLGTLGTSNLNISRAWAINNSGQVVGYSSLDDGNFHAFLWTQAGGMKDLGTINGGTDSFAFGISSSGRVVGDASPSSQGGQGVTAFVWSKATGMLPLGLGALSEAFGINDFNEIVGYRFTSYPSNAFLWTPAHQAKYLISLIPPDSGWTLNLAYAINHSGQIAGYGTLNGNVYGTLLTISK
jgi:probable HAF family extracellular repeat protein